MDQLDQRDLEIRMLRSQNKHLLKTLAEFRLGQTVVIQMATPKLESPTTNNYYSELKLVDESSQPVADLNFQKLENFEESKWRECSRCQETGPDDHEGDCMACGYPRTETKPTQSAEGFEDALNLMHPQLKPVDCDIRNAARWGYSQGTARMQREVEAAVKAMNSAIPLIRKWTNINSAMGPDLQDAANLLSSFLSKQPEQQSRYLDRISALEREKAVLSKNLEFMHRFTRARLQHAQDCGYVKGGDVCTCEAIKRIGK